MNNWYELLKLCKVSPVNQENFAAVQIPTLSGAITLNVSGGNCNITINKN